MALAPFYRSCLLIVTSALAGFQSLKSPAVPLRPFLSLSLLSQHSSIHTNSDLSTRHLISPLRGIDRPRERARGLIQMGEEAQRMRSIDRRSARSISGKGRKSIVAFLRGYCIWPLCICGGEASVRVPHYTHHHRRSHIQHGSFLFYIFCRFYTALALGSARGGR